jgi:hypothetical protein
LRTTYRILTVIITIFIVAILVVACTADPTIVVSKASSARIEVAPPFADFYSQNGGEQAFGRPITAAFVDTKINRTIQYFETVRMEEDPTMAEGNRATLAPIGQWVFDGLRVTFADPNYSLGGPLLTFYEDHGGEHVFGRVISPLFAEGDRLVQYLENARLEWHPDAVLEERVQVGHLGYKHYQGTGMDLVYRDFIAARPASAATVTEAVVSAAITPPIVYRGDRVTLYVAAQSPEGRPVEDAVVSYAINADPDSFGRELGVTNGDGWLRRTLRLPNLPPGERVQIDIVIHGSSGAVLGRTTVTFKTWW